MTAFYSVGGLPGISAFISEPCIFHNSAQRHYHPGEISQDPEGSRSVDRGERMARQGTLHGGQGLICWARTWHYRMRFWCWQWQGEPDLEDVIKLEMLWFICSLLSVSGSDPYLFPSCRSSGFILTLSLLKSSIILLVKLWTLAEFCSGLFKSVRRGHHDSIMTTGIAFEAGLLLQT